LCRASIENQWSLLALVNYDPTPTYFQVPPRGSEPSDILSVAYNLDPEAFWAIHDFMAPVDNGQTIAEAIRNGSAIAVSDGSYKDKFGTAAWALEGKTALHRITGHCVIPGDPNDQSPYRSELGGLYAMAVMAAAVCKLHQVSSGAIEIACDGLSAIRQVGDIQAAVRPNGAQFDLIAATKYWLSRSPITWTFRHVLGHQDALSSAMVLDRWETINCEMDIRAKRYWQLKQRDRPNGPTSMAIAGEPWALWLGELKVCSRTSEQIREFVRGDTCKKYWDAKTRFQVGTSAQVNWEAVAQAM
jgi:hypothetical protein